MLWHPDESVSLKHNKNQTFVQEVVILQIQLPEGPGNTMKAYFLCSIY